MIHPSSITRYVLVNLTRYVKLVTLQIWLQYLERYWSLHRDYLSSKRGGLAATRDYFSGQLPLGTDLKVHQK